MLFARDSHERWPSPSNILNVLGSNSGYDRSAVYFFGRSYQMVRFRRRRDGRWSAVSVWRPAMHSVCRRLRISLCASTYPNV